MNNVFIKNGRKCLKERRQKIRYRELVKYEDHLQAQFIDLNSDTDIVQFKVHWPQTHFIQ